MSSVFRVFDNIYDIMLVIDADRNVFYGNESAAQLLDVATRRMQSGKPLANFFTYEQGLLEDGVDLATVVEPTPSRETTFQTSGGKDGWTQVSVQALPEAMQAASGHASKLFLVYMRDVTLERILAKKFQDQLDAKEHVIKDLKVARQDLENYSKNLEKMVEARTVELREANRMIATILDSLGQGIFVFDKNGTCLPFYSKVSEKMFGMAPSDRQVFDVLKMNPQEKSHFEKWMEAVFSEMLDFQDLVPLAPSKLTHSSDRHVAFDFHPMKGEANSLRGVVLVATDKTDEMRAKKEAERERSFARRVVQIVQHRQQFKSFASEAFRICADLADKLGSGVGLSSEEVARHLHTVKGGAASFSLVEIAEIAHRSEDQLIKYLRDNEIAASEVLTEWPVALRLKIKNGVDEIVTSLKEFLESHSFLMGANRQTSVRTAEVSISTLVDWYRRSQDSASAALLGREIFQNWVQEPAAKSFSHVDSSLKEMADRLGKKIAPLQFSGDDVRILPEAFSELFATYIHAFRNALDHGIETPEERSLIGKPETGQITVSFERFFDGDRAYLKTEIRDDGRGISPEKIKARLAEKNIPYDANASGEEIIQAVFRDDFSTSTDVSDISGRGVGLSAIKMQVEQNGGSVKVRSFSGEGSVLTVIVPDLGEHYTPAAELKQAG